MSNDEENKKVDLRKIFVNQTLERLKHIKPVKEIESDLDSGKYYLLNNDDSNRIEECTQFGTNKDKFRLGISGFKSYDYRLSHKIISPQKFLRDKSLYHPQGKLFEGYFQFPRPLSKPFINLERPEKEKNKLISSLSSGSIHFSLEKNKNLVNLKTNQGLHYLSGTIDEEDLSNKNRIVNLINESVNEYNWNKSMGKRQSYTPGQIRSLLSIKSKIMQNNSNKVFNRKLSDLPNERILEDNYIIKKVIKNNIQRVKKRECLSQLKKRPNNIFDKENCKNEKNEDKLEFLSNYGDNEEKYKKVSIFKRKINIFEEKPIPREKGIFRKGVPKLPTNGDLYKKEMELLKKVNKKVVEKEESDLEKDKMFFMKRRELSLLKSKLNMKKN